MYHLGLGFQQQHITQKPLVLDPLVVAELYAWYDTTSLVTSGNVVTGWNDKTANALHFAQSNATLRPVFDAANNEVVFQGVGIRLQRTGALIAANTSHTIMFAARRLAAGSIFNDTVLEQGDDGSNWGAKLTYSDSTIWHKIVTSSGSNDGKSSIVQPVGEYMVGNHAWNQAINTAVLRRNGTQIHSFTRTGTIRGDATVTHIGSRSSLTTSIGIKEMLVFNKTLTPEIRTLAEQYLAARAGVILAV